MSVTDYSVLSKVEPEKSLLAPLNKKAGRNSYGRITVRHPRRRQPPQVPHHRLQAAKARRTRYGADPGIRSQPFRLHRLVQYQDGEKRYILPPNGLKVGDVIVSGPNADIKPGNALPLENIPTGTFIHNVELYPGKGGQLARSAGNMAQLMAKENGMALLRLPSGELRNVSAKCMATVGQVSNTDHENVKVGKAGRKRHMGWRPTVRGFRL